MSSHSQRSRLTTDLTWTLNLVFRLLNYNLCWKYLHYNSEIRKKHTQCHVFAMCLMQLMTLCHLSHTPFSPCFVSKHHLMKQKCHKNGLKNREQYSLPGTLSEG